MGVTIDRVADRAEDLRHKGYHWKWRRYQKWEERNGARYPFRVESIPLVTSATQAFCIGSCFAERVSDYLTTLGIAAHSFGHSRQYDTSSIRQTIDHLLVAPQYSADDIFATEDGKYAHPFRNPRHRADTIEELLAWSDAIEQDARAALRDADVVIITLGGTETWRHPVTKKVYLVLPLPDVFNSQMPEIAEFHNLTYAENYANLEHIYLTLREHVPDADVLFTVSPVRMTFSVSGKDVAVATSQAKGTLRAAVGELTDSYHDHLHYFHSYEVAQYAPPGARFFEDDDIHVNDACVNAVMHEFARCFVAPEARSREWTQRDLAIGDSTAVEFLDDIQPFDVRAGVRSGLVRALRTARLEGLARAAYRRMRARG